MTDSFIIINDTVRQNALRAVMDAPTGKVVSIEDRKKTPPQRRYWHKCLSVMCEGTGYELIELKTIIKRQVFGTKIFKDRKGKEYERDISSEELGVKEYSQLIDRTKLLAEMAGITLPTPAMYGIE